MDTQQRTYWTYQLLGWLAYSAVGSAINLLNHVDPVTLLVNHLVLIAASIAMTHAFRATIRRRRPPNAQSVSRWFLTAGVLLIGTVQTALVIGVDVAMRHEPWPWISVAGLGWGMYLATGVWTMLYTRITERRMRDERELQLRLTAREAELRALQYQTNPHFLFNSLNSIRALVLENPARAQDMLTRLANILRHSLQRDPAQTVPLESEIGVVTDYLALETVRFEQRLRTRFDIDPALREALVPPMLLQTLVENAVKHGIAQAPAGGDLVIRAHRQNGSIRLEVENTGELSGSTSGDQLGLSNARQRLELLYGNRASLDLRHVTSGSVTATVLLPA